MACSRLLPFSLALVLLSLAFRPARPRTVAVDGVAQSEVPALVIGDSVGKYTRERPEVEILVVPPCLSHTLSRVSFCVLARV